MIVNEQTRLEDQQRPENIPNTMAEQDCFVVYHTNASANDYSCDTNSLSTFLWQ